MIVLSAGMQKAGTAWYFNLTNDMLIANGHQDVRRIRTRFHLERFMSADNCNIGTPRAWKLFLISVPHFLGQTYVIKTHEGPTLGAKAAVKTGQMKATYIFRDPRDVVVSLFEHGERIRKSKARSATGFDRLETLEAAIEFVRNRLSIWRAWANVPRVLTVRYEDLQAGPVRECERLARFLGLELSRTQIAEIVDRYDAERASAGKAPFPLHFNKGLPGRWQEVLSPAQGRLCQDRFGDSLSEMGYAV